MNRILLMVLLAASLVACGGGEEAPPPDVLPFDRMVEVTADIQFEAALMQKRMVQRNHLQPLVEERYREVFDKHGLTLSDYEASFNWYKLHPDELLAVYEEVLEIFSERMAQARAKQQAAPTTTGTQGDSLRQR